MSHASSYSTPKLGFKIQVEKLRSQHTCNETLPATDRCPTYLLGCSLDCFLCLSYLKSIARSFECVEFLLSTNDGPFERFSATSADFHPFPAEYSSFSPSMQREKAFSSQSAFQIQSRNAKITMTQSSLRPAAFASGNRLCVGSRALFYCVIRMFLVHMPHSDIHRDGLSRSWL